MNISREALVDALGLRDENWMIEQAVDRLITSVQWFAQASEGVQGVTERDVSAMRLLAVSCALAILVHDQPAPDARGCWWGRSAGC